MRMPGKTVRVQWSREDEFAGAPISTAMAIGLRAVLDADNRPADWTIEIWSRAARPASRHERQLQPRSASRRCPIAPPPNELGDVPDERGGGATRNACRDLRPAASPADPSSAAASAAAHVVAARARRLGQRVRHRVLHGRTGGDRRRRSGDLPARAAVRSARTPRGRDRRADERLVRAAQPARRPGARLRLRPLQEHRLVRRRGRRDRGRRRGAPQARVVRGRCGPRDLAGRRAQPDRRRHHHGRELRDEASSVRFADGKVAAATWEDYPILRFSRQSRRSKSS